MYVHVAGVVVNPGSYGAGGMNSIESAGFFERGLGAWYGVGRDGKLEAVRVLAMPIRVKTWDDAQS